MYTCIYTYIYIYIDMYWYTYKYVYVCNVRSCSFKLAMVRSANSRSGGSELCVWLYIHVCARVCVWTESEWKSKRMGKNKREICCQLKKRGQWALCVCLSTCVCVCMHERERARKQARESVCVRDLLQTPQAVAASSLCVYVHVCVRVCI